MIKYTLPVFYAHLQLASLCNLCVDNVSSIMLPLMFRNCVSVYSGIEAIECSFTYGGTVT